MSEKKDTGKLENKKFEVTLLCTLPIGNDAVHPYSLNDECPGNDER